MVYLFQQQNIYNQLVYYVIVTQQSTSLKQHYNRVAQKECHTFDQ